MIWIFIIVLLAFAILEIIIYSNKLYCYYFEHEDWNEWEKYIKDIDKFKYDRKYLDCYIFIIPNTDIRAYIWADGSCSIHDNIDCVCCNFDKYHSNKMKKLLMDKI